MNASPDGIAVFGSSEPAPGDPLYERAFRLARLLAEAGYRVVNGGYGGVMEASTRGARSAGGPVLGVVCSIFKDRQPSAQLTEVVETPDLFSRTRELIRRSAGFVVLDGKAGTLAELTMLWAMHRAGCLYGRPVILLGTRWKGLLEQLERAGMVDSPQLDLVDLVEEPEQAVEALKRATGGR